MLRSTVMDTTTFMNFMNTLGEQVEIPIMIFSMIKIGGWEKVSL